MIPIPLVDDCLLIDNSSTETIITCRRKAEYYIGNKRQFNGDRWALTFGRIVHKVLEVRARLMTHTITPEITTAMINMADNELQKHPPPEDDFRNYAFLLDLINEYNAFYPIESYRIAQHNNQPLIEVGFIHPLGEITLNTRCLVRNPDGSTIERFVQTIKVMQTGRIDQVVTHQDRLYGLDHKTTSMMGPTYFKEFDMSSQMVAYKWAIEELTGRKITGFIINALGMRKPTKTGKKLEFQRYTVHTSDESVTEWKRDAMSHISTYLSDCIEGYTPKGTKWCVGKYGACEFFDVCTLPHDQRPIMLATNNYRNVTWDPLNPDAK